MFKADWTTEDRCLNTIRSTFGQTGYVLDTHTAVAKDVAGRFVDANRPMIISATAHYSKFARDVLKGLRHVPIASDPVELLASLRRLHARPTAHDNLESAVRRPHVQKAICNADVSTVMDEIYCFLRR
ncbi:Threonine synthase-like 1 [Desmophyllum pertusum]|uniref:Threonine synthase-like 1 n=1 Tax=Desmophyllum pertusum TaxID=174260 RepID=A0A9W9ZDU3_9CNID|nr:Threonine synthase-like 1 [Desmophyllum pertusum]